MTVIELLISFVFSFVFLYCFRRFLTGNRVSAGGDTFFHLLISKSIHNRKGAYPTNLENVAFYEGEKKYDYLAYPPLLHYIVALLPNRYHLQASKLLNLLLLSILSTLSVEIVYLITSNWYVAFLSGLFVLFNMAAFELEALFTPRPLGLLFYSFLMFIVIFYSSTLFLLVLIPILVALVTMTHKFATQVLLFTLVPYAFIFGEYLLLLGIFMGFVLSILVTKGRYLKILNEHVSWLYFYSRFPYKYSVKEKIKRVAVRNIWYLPVFIAFAMALIGTGMVYSFDLLILELLYWAFMPLIIAFLVVIPKLSFLGEDYRYVEYSIVPVATLCSIAAFDNLLILASIIFSFVVCSLVMLKYKERISKLNELVKVKDVASYQSLNGKDFGNLLVCPPNRTLEVSFFTDVKVVHLVRGKESRTQEENLKALIKQYGVRFILRFKYETSGTFALLNDRLKLKKVLDLESIEILEIVS